MVSSDAVAPEASADPTIALMWGWPFTVNWNIGKGPTTHWLVTRYELLPEKTQNFGKYSSFDQKQLGTVSREFLSYEPLHVNSLGTWGNKDFGPERDIWAAHQSTLHSRLWLQVHLVKDWKILYILLVRVQWLSSSISSNNFRSLNSGVDLDLETECGC